MVKVEDNKISVITVVFNNVANIKDTMDSFFSQTWENKEYIVIDGGSTDGTVDIIKQYADRLVYWCSEKDDGLYEAMNKGIEHVTGDWVNILNSGDTYASVDSLKNALTMVDDLENADVIYGDSIEKSETELRLVEAIADVNELEYKSIYRHGSSLIRTEVQQKFLYDTSKKNEFGYGLDSEMIYRVFKAGCCFKKSNCTIEIYEREGMSSVHPTLSLWYNYKITSNNKLNIRKFIFFLKLVIVNSLYKSLAHSQLKSILLDFIPNNFLTIIPFWIFRKLYFKCIRAKIYNKAIIARKNYFKGPNHLTIGTHSTISSGCTIDARGKITIGNNVFVSNNVSITTGVHDFIDSKLVTKIEPIVIGDNVLLGIGCTILKGVRIGKGAVICAGAVVTSDVQAYDIVEGVPAKPVGVRIGRFVQDV